MTRDSGSIVLGWLTKLAASLAVVGLLAFDGLALVTAHVSAADQATTVASVAADAYKATHDVQQAYDAAATEAGKNGDTVETKTFTVQQPDGRVTLTVHKEATTLWLYRIGFLKQYIDVKASGEAAPAQ